MGRSSLAAFLAVSALAAWGVARPSPPPESCKPQAPIEIDARLVGDPSAPFGILAEASSPTGKEVELEVVLPDGVTPTAGAFRERGRQPKLRIDARARDARRREILVRATIRTESGVLTRVVPLVLNDAPESPKGTPKRNSRGESIVEFAP